MFKLSTLFSLLATLLVASCGGNSGTYVLVSMAAGANAPAGVKTVLLKMTLAGHDASETLAGKNGAALTLPASVVLDIDQDAGPLTVVATALDAAGAVLATANATGTVVRGATLSLTLTFSTTAATSGLVATPASADFGSVAVGGSAPAQTFTITNSGAQATAALTSSVASGPFAVADDGCSGKTLAPAASCTIGATFSPTAIGSASAALDVGDGTRVASIALAGTGTTPGTLAPSVSSLAFGSVTQGQASSELTLTLTNSGSAASGAISVALGGANHAEFAVTHDGCSTLALTPNASCTIGVTFEPIGQQPSGTKAATLTLGATPGGSSVVQLGATSLTPGSVSITPSSGDLGTIDVDGTPGTQTFTLTNSGGSATGVLAAALSPAAGDFSLVAGKDGCSGQTLAGGASCSLQVAFAPATYGAKSASLVLTGAPFTSLTVPLAGLGRDRVTLKVVVDGDGQVTAPATGDVGGVAISCGATCADTFYRTSANPVITLTANPAGDAHIGSWSSAGCGTSPTCGVTLSQSTTVTVNFALDTVTLQVATSTLAGGGGTVTSSDSKISCGATCSANEPVSNTPITLTANATAGNFLGWSGDCQGVGNTCQVTMTAAHSVRAMFGPANVNRMFVTSKGLAMPFGTTAALATSNANAHCKALATAAGLGGTNWVALLSTSTGSALSKLPASAGWVRSDGQPVGNTPSMFATAPAQGTLYYPPRLDELGNDLAAAYKTGTAPLTVVATATTGAGQLGGSNCSDFTVASTATVNGGDFMAAGGYWVDVNQVTCNTTNALLYCFQTDYTTTVVPPAFNAGKQRGAFVTKGSYGVSSGGSIANFDAACQQEASAAGLPSPTTYQALVAPSGGVTAASRFTAGLPWYRLDGVEVFDSLADLSDSNLLAVIDQGPDKSYLVATPWTGSYEAGVAGSNNNCTNWSSNSAGLTGTAGFDTYGYNWCAAGGSMPCNQTAGLYCMQK